MIRTSNGYTYNRHDINQKIGEVAAANNIILSQVETADIISFAEKNEFKNTAKFHSFITMALRTAPVKQ